MKDDSLFYTRDLVLATFLVYSGVKLAKGYDKETGSWVFYDPVECASLSLDLRNGDATVEILKYESIRRNLLGMVHDNTTSSVK
jgi:ABC-type arginine/histidine transport system permease subunit